ncbi:MAG: hypothetical protein LBD58_12580 [Treponema sp.]|jgi:hypothetical protein|nr:hypothetical protein [Treponema sp.]
MNRRSQPQAGGSLAKKILTMNMSTKNRLVSQSSLLANAVDRGTLSFQPTYCSLIP